MSVRKVSLLAAFSRAIALLGLGLSSCGVALAENALPMPASSLSIELNAVQQLEDNACRLIFVAQNATGLGMDKMALEAVLFDARGTVSRFSLFDFRDLPDAKMRVRQFDLPDTECTSLARILVNGAATCTIAGQESSVCVDRLTVNSMTEIEFVG